MSNTAAYQNTFMSRPFSIEPAPMPLPKPHQIIIQTRAIGINPFDAAVQNLGLVYDAAAHPVVLGVDVAGIVQSVGEKVTRFHPGDSVCACTIGMTSGTSEHQQQHDSFQLYCASRAAFAARIPDNVSFSEAAVFLSCMKTAAYALFVKDTLALDLPPITSRAAPNGKVLIVWGGSSIVGSCAIQMASLAGYTVIATPSEHNFEHCRALGADSVFDYKSPSVIEDIVTACKATGKEPVGALVAYFNNDSTVTCSHIVSQLGGSKIVGTVVPPYTPVPEAAAGSVKVTSNWGPSLGETEAGIHLWQHWLTPALADGRMELFPRLEVHGQGLEALQGAVDTMFERVHMPFASEAEEVKSISPRKLVV